MKEHLFGREREVVQVSSHINSQKVGWSHQFNKRNKIKEKWGLRIVKGMEMRCPLPTSCLFLNIHQCQCQCQHQHQLFLTHILTVLLSSGSSDTLSVASYFSTSSFFAPHSFTSLSFSLYFLSFILSIVFLLKYKSFFFSKHIFN